ncbi:SDR family NAD(P)-dependent oxidoreductase [Dyadobacter frigoris]|uniref:SDR family oxidoreductase n=1 Tax=Dyadobacter frigoris TaxID=2576211 RepID=A0A4U6D432_9BACT|nr:SDR family oxidoreductase [Dyadobacter frigoris]TKT91992.1 SDR family oxidoreductase [Dyadobacter frigoris]GLU53132.1 short-chain dehydrogenase [Dyadobacter frigoris]
MKNLKGKTAFVTGASSGIGLAFAHALAEMGMNIILTARSTEKLNQEANIISKKFRVKTYVVACDLSQKETPDKLYQFVRENQLSVDLLINNAGFGKWGNFLEETIPTYENMLEVNINAVVKLSHLFLPEMLAKGEGGIINVASTGAFQPCPYIATYAASKAFVLSFSEALYGEYYKRGITVTALCPGNTATGFQEVAGADTSKMYAESAETVAKEGIQAFIQGQNCKVNGMGNNLQSLIPKFLPRKMVIKIVEKMMNKRVNAQ